MIWTVETGAYSDHTIHAFCTSEAEAIRQAEQVLTRKRAELGLEEESISEHDIPEIYRNPTDALLDSWVSTDGAKPERVYWHPLEERPAAKAMPLP